MAVAVAVEVAAAVEVEVEVEVEVAAAVLAGAKASIVHQATFPVGQKTGAFCARFHSLRSLRPQPPTNHIHQVTTIAQWNDQQLGKVRQHHRVATNFGSVGDVFQHLRNRSNPVIGHGLQDVEWGLGVDEQGGRNQVDSGEGYVSIHCEDLCLIGSRLSLSRRQTNGWQLCAGWRTGTEKTGRPEGLPRTAAITAALRVR
ncbi:hypothetical protein D3C75_823600 [compost metagenome]